MNPTGALQARIKGQLSLDKHDVEHLLAEGRLLLVIAVGGWPAVLRELSLSPLLLLNSRLDQIEEVLCEVKEYEGRSFHELQIYHVGHCDP